MRQYTQHNVDTVDTNNDLYDHHHDGNDINVINATYNDDNYEINNNNNNNNNEFKDISLISLDDGDLNENENENENENVYENDMKEEDECDLSENEEIFFKMKREVKSKKKATFCCIFSIGSLILSIILLLAPLSTQMIDDWKLYNSSINTQCEITDIYIIVNATYWLSKKTINNNINTNIYNNKQCLYQYERTDNKQFNNLCNSKMYETVSCDFVFNDQYNVGYVGQCCFYPNNDDYNDYNDYNDNHKNNITLNKLNECQGTMVNILTLQRNNDIFIVLLSIGAIFCIITICSGIYGIYLIRLSGIYCSIISSTKDNDDIFNLMQKLQENKYEKKKLSSLQTSTLTSKSTINSINSTLNLSLNSTLNKT